MKNLMLLPFLILVGIQPCTAQSGWQPFDRTIDYQNHVEAGVSLVILDDTIFFFSKGWNQQDPYMLRKVVLNKCDLEGHLLSQRILFESDPYSYQPVHSSEILITPDSNLMLITTKTDGISASNPYDVFLAELTRNGDTIWTKQHYNRDTTEVPYKCKWTPWGDLVCVGCAIKSSSQWDAFIALYTENGAKVWDRYLTYDPISIIASTPKINSNTKQIIATGGTAILGTGYRGLRWTFDSTGTVIYQTYMSGFESSALSSYDDLQGGYVGLQSTFPSNPDHKPYVVRSYDSMWNEKWAVQLEDLNDMTSLSHLEVLPDSSFLICGWGYTDENPTSNYGELIKVTKEGQVEWHRRYYLSNAYLDASLSYVTYYEPGNSIYGIGTTLRPGRNNSDAWLVRFDSVGCLEPGCDTIVGRELPMPLYPEILSVYPSPASGLMAVDIPPKLRESAHQLIIRNLAGQEVLKDDLSGAPRKILDVSDLPSGLYLLEIWEADGLLGRAKFVKQ